MRLSYDESYFCFRLWFVGYLLYRIKRANDRDQKRRHGEVQKYKLLAAYINDEVFTNLKLVV